VVVTSQRPASSSGQWGEVCPRPPERAPERGPSAGPLAPAHLLAAAALQVELVEPPQGCVPGDRITAAGFDGPPDEQLAPKKKVFETVQPDLATDAALVACYKGLPLACPQGACTVKSVAGGSIR